MKIVNRPLGDSADASSARHTAMPELRRLLVFTAILAISTYFVISVAVDLIVENISYETEAKLFSKVQFSRSAGTASLQQTNRLESILAAFSEDEHVPPLPYKIVVMPSAQTNAFAFPGGTIGVTEGLMTALDKDIELAFVIGHELGHFKNRDHLRGLGRAIGVSIAYAVIFGGEMGSSSVGQVFQFVLDRNYSRTQETFADRFGVDLIFRKYGKTDGIEKLFEILEHCDQTPAWAYMFATHPAPGDRIAELRRYADQLPAVSGEM